ncbi:MAG: hypothetical protein IIC70_13095, partial [Acidobacteria bacterium]|nr:hypothetical protein [Acidobacteriota bacterium]
AWAGFFLQWGAPLLVVMAQDLKPDMISTVSGVMLGLAWGLSTLILWPVSYLVQYTRFDIVVLMGAAAMAVDLGWLFWQSIEIQHGADAAALAGVVYEPDQRDEAHTQGTAAAVENGFVHDPLNGDEIEILDFVDDPTAVEQSSQLRAIVTRRVPTFFMKVFGLGTVDISRTALAEYEPPRVS